MTYPALQVAIDTNTIGDNVLVSGETGKRIVVMAYTLIARTTVDVRWKSGSVARSGLLPLIDSVGASPAYNPEGVIICAPGDNLVLNLSGSVYVGGHITYKLKE
jgi:hypothetical protein